MWTRSERGCSESSVNTDLKKKLWISWTAEQLHKETLHGDTVISAGTTMFRLVLSSFKVSHWRDAAL